jgi:hypothetical protein
MGAGEMVSLAETVDVVVWTQKRVDDYRARHPHRKNLYKAGEKALYDGKPVNPESSICEAYIMRGWVEVEHRKKEVNVKERWRTIKMMLGDNKKIREIADVLGITEMQLKVWCLQNGRKLAKRYGKLPYIPRRLSPLWRDIMEPKPAPKYEVERQARRKTRWIDLQKATKKKAGWEQVAEKHGLTPKALRAFVSNWGADLSEEYGKLPFDSSAPKFLKRYMEVS